MSSEDQDERDPSASPAPGATPTVEMPLESFAGLADLDEDLRTMSQSSKELERWRRLSTRGLTAAGGADRDEVPGKLDAPVIDPELAREASVDQSAVATAPGTLHAPRGAFEPAGDDEDVPLALEKADPDRTARHPSVRPLADPDRTAKHPSVSPPADPDRTAKHPSVRPLAAGPERAARKSFAPPKDSPSAPPGSRVVLPSSPPVMSASNRPPTKSSRPPPRVPRPTSQPPPEPGIEVQGWRASDPGSHQAIEPAVASAAAAHAIPPPPMVAPRPSAIGTPPPSASSPLSSSPSASSPLSSSPMQRLEEPLLMEQRTALIVAGVVVCLVIAALWWVLH